MGRIVPQEERAGSGRTACEKLRVAIQNWLTEELNAAEVEERGAATWLGRTVGDVIMDEEELTKAMQSYAHALGWKRAVDHLRDVVFRDVDCELFEAKAREHFGGMER